MRNIRICSQLEAAVETIKNPGFWNVVSIRGVGCESKIQDRHCKSIIRLNFDDVFSKDDKNAPTKEDVKQALDFAKDIDDNILVHCRAGVSRSSAIAYLIACQDRSPEEAMKILDYKIHIPNDLIITYGAELLDKPEMLHLITEFCKKCIAYYREIGE